ncbi:MAG: DUF922 domain-containing protein [Dinghuibacter sp.]|nr:DUF922 domain-containing protein [Dinghuibacter sp.]
MKYKKSYSAMLALVICTPGFVKNNPFVQPPYTAKAIQLDVRYDSTLVRSGADTIVYTPNKKVHWGQFTGAVPANAPAAANSAVGFMFKAGVASNSNGSTISIRIAAYFIPRQSWVQARHKTGYILEHEQRHFDIARYGAELFRKKLLATRFNAGNISKNISAAYEAAWTEYLALQEQYDKETSHSINEAKQAEWNKKLDEWMKTVP